MSGIKRWQIVIDNNDVDGVDVEYVEGTKEQVIDYVKELCFKWLKESHGAEYVSFGEKNNACMYGCCVQFSTYHVDITASVCEPKFESLADRELEYTKFDDDAGLNEEETELWYNLTDMWDLTEKETVELLQNPHYLEDLLELQDVKGCLDVYSSLAECGAANTDNGCREADDTDEMFGQFLVQNYKDNSKGYENFCVLLKSGRVVQAVC